MSPDARGWRIALLPDRAVNPPDGQNSQLDLLRVLDAHGYGLLQLPPTQGGVDPSLLLAVIADQVAEYAHHGYAVVAVGLRGEPNAGLHWRRLTALLRHRYVPPPPRYVCAMEGDPDVEERELSVFLSAHDIPLEEQRVWRT
jgi:hypothetical protein